MNNRSSNAEFHRRRQPRVWIVAALTMTVIVGGLVVGDLHDCIGKNHGSDGATLAMRCPATAARPY